MAEKIERHLYVEFSLGKVQNGDSVMLIEEGLRNELNESHGVIPNLAAYLTVFESAFNNGKRKLSMDDFSAVENCFFDSIKVNIGGNDSPLNGGYSQTGSGFYKKNDGSYGYHVGISLANNGNIEKLKTVFAHELTHAYDDFCRKTGRKNGKPSLALLDLDNKIGIKRAILVGLADGGEPTKALGLMLYYLNDAEKNAYIGQTYAELISNVEKIGDSSTAFQELKKTEAWDIYTWLRKNIKYLQVLAKDNSDEAKGKKAILLWAYEFITTIKEKDFSCLVKYLTKKYKAWEHHFLNQASKMVYDAYCDFSINKFSKNGCGNSLR